VASTYVGGHYRGHSPTAMRALSDALDARPAGIDTTLDPLASSRGTAPTPTPETNDNG
jgi:hypothetical protein